MADREKVLNGLECLAQVRDPVANPCRNCKYADRPNYAMCVVDCSNDALELLKSEPQWISTKDRTPEQAGCYLAYRHSFWACGRGQITVCYWDGKNWFDHYIAEEDYELWGDSVSYWMPLPEQPKDVSR